jgi:adenylyltransferase/sulfurtransferase
MDERYSRQILFKEIGRDGQKKLADSTVLIVGCGALGSAHAESLARAGIGHLRLVDRDFVEFSNLQRQTLFREQDAADRLPKAAAAKRRLGEINSSVETEALIDDVNNSNVERLINGCDVVLDGTDNFQVRYLVNDACVKNEIPWVYGAAVSSYGVTMTIRPGESPCLRCIFEDMPEPGSSPTCDTAGVIMPIITTISAIQVTEAVKLMIGDVASLHGSLIQLDIWQNDRQQIKLGAPDADCKACGKREFDFLNADAADSSAVLCGRNAVQIAPIGAAGIDLEQLASRLEHTGEIKKNEFLVRFNADEYEITVFKDGRAIIRGTDDISAARSVYARFVGA